MDRTSINGGGTADVLIIGGGLAGLAAATRLAEGGRSVTVIDDPVGGPNELGESLEFSAPRALRAIGIEPAELLADGVGFGKTNVFVDQAATGTFEIWPPGWFRHPPLFGSHETLHINRAGLEEELRKRADEAGVSFLADRVTEVDATDEGSSARITALALRSGGRVTAHWYLDAGGHRSRVIGRALRLPITPIGDERMAIHARFLHRPRRPITQLLFSANAERRMTWGWVLPIGPDRTSIGAVVPVDELRRARRTGRSNDDLFWGLVREFGHLDLPRADQIIGEGVATRAYTPYVHHDTSGPNWALMGDAATLLDPITSSGVATALLSAGTAAELVAADLAGSSRRMPPGRRRAGVAQAHRGHHHLTVRTATVINRLVDRVLHRRGLRALVGTRIAVFTFAITNVLINAWYSRLQPTTRWRMAAHRLLLWAAAALTGAAGVLDAIVRRLPVMRGR
ncbi:MAG: tryptophan 7-halogenase [Actinomycetota bacterium]